MRNRPNGFARPINHAMPLSALARLTVAPIPRYAGRLVADLRNIVACRLPGASGFSFHPFETWSSLYITVSTDEAVTKLGGALGLGAQERRAVEGQWWYRAASPHDLDITVVGPLHKQPPAGDVSGASLP